MAFGKKNHVNIDPLSYSICLLGEAKVGKSSLVYKVCEKLVGSDGYLFLELGEERGADAIEGINYINCPEWEMDEYDEFSNSHGFSNVCDDIIENKSTEYPNLKVIVWDTYDQLITLAEKEAIRLWNKECKATNNHDKVTKSINAAWGGFGKGEKKAIDLMFDYKKRLKNVGVETLVIGHVKTKDITDVVSGETYQTLTSDQQQNYFNALKKQLHFLGLAYIDRSIKTEKTGKKNVVTKKEETKNVIVDEKRKIKFRDDNYAVDSGSRFADIIPEINLDADEFIKALTDAIKAEQSKSGKSFEETKKEQDAEREQREEEVAKMLKAEKEKKDLEAINNEIYQFIVDKKDDKSAILPVLKTLKENGLTSPKDITDMSLAKEILKLTK